MMSTKIESVKHWKQKNVNTLKEDVQEKYKIILTADTTSHLPSSWENTYSSESTAQKLVYAEISRLGKHVVSIITVDMNINGFVKTLREICAVT